jgi:hypothetical protein
MRWTTFNGVLAVALAGAAGCGDQARGGIAPGGSVAPAYGDFVVALDSVTVQAQVASSDTFPIRLHPRAPFTECSPWVLVTHYGWGASFTLYGVNAPPTRPPCAPIMARAVFLETDSSPFVPLVFVQPDSTLLRRYIRVEAEPMRIDSSTSVSASPTRQAPRPPSP